MYTRFNPFRAVGALMTLIDFTLSNTRRFYSSMGDPLALKGLNSDFLPIFREQYYFVRGPTSHN